MADALSHRPAGTLRPAVTTEPRWLRLGLTAAVLALLGVLVLAPLVAVFAEALADGLAEAVGSLASPDAWPAIRLTARRS
jgi:sulfate transport system permease protein